MRTITLEEHFVTRGLVDATRGYLPANPQMETIQRQLLDLGAGRIAAMDEGGVDVQVLSLAALGIDQLDRETATPLLRDTNDELAAAVKAHPERLAGFAALGLKDPASAAKELERTVSQLGFKGALLDGTVDGEFLDQPKFAPVFEAAEQLGVPIYLHPAPPPEAVRRVYFSGLPEGAGQLLSIAGWGWHAENGLHLLRLIVAGVFDRYPKLQLIVGHMGEGVPYALARSNHVLGAVTKHLKRSVAETFHDQVHVTTSGYFTVPPFLCALEVVGPERLLYSVDYPFSPTARGRDFLEAMPVSPADKERIAHGNAERLLKLGPHTSS